MDIINAACDMISANQNVEYAAKIIKMAQEAETFDAQVMTEMIQDTVEISQEAMNRYLAELNQM